MSQNRDENKEGIREVEFGSYIKRLAQPNTKVYMNNFMSGVNSLNLELLVRIESKWTLNLSDKNGENVVLDEDALEKSEVHFLRMEGIMSEFNMNNWNFNEYWDTLKRTVPQED